MPKFKGVEEDFIIAPKISIKASDDSWFFTEDEEGSYYVTTMRLTNQKLLWVGFLILF